jgi:hypothetical protein
MLVPVQCSAASSSQAPPCDAPTQLVPAGAMASAGHAPDDPVHFSATSHGPAADRHVVVAGRNMSTHAALVPAQWSSASLSHIPACDTPVQCVALDRKASTGHVPEVPVQLSATSHAVVAARQTVALVRKTSTHAALVPAQWSAASLLHAPPWDDPVHGVALDLNTSVGQAPEVPLQLSATSQELAAALQTVPLERNTSTQVVLAPVHRSAASSSQPPPWEVPMQCAPFAAMTSAGHAPDVPVQVSARSQPPTAARHTVALDR